jgi:hypothetical protein
MRGGLFFGGLLGFAAIASAEPPVTQNEQGRCVSLGVESRFREAAPAEKLAAEIVAACIPERRTGREANPEHRAYFDTRYAEEREGTITGSARRIERLRQAAAAAAAIPEGQPTLTEPVAEQIIRIASSNWPKPMRVQETRLSPPEHGPIPQGEWERVARRRVTIEAGNGRYATYYLDEARRVTALFLNSSPAPDCRPFRAGETLAAEAALMAVPGATAEEIARVRASARTGWSGMYARLAVRVGAYVFVASRAGGSAPGRVGCHDHLSLTLDRP